MSKDTTTKSVPTPKYRPSFYVSESELPEIKDWKMGKKYKLIIEAELVGMQNKSSYVGIGSEESGEKDEGKDEGIEARFKIASVSTPEAQSKVGSYLKEKASS